MRGWVCVLMGEAYELSDGTAFVWPWVGNDRIGASDIKERFPQGNAALACSER